MWPALIAAGLLVYVTCLGEFVASIMIYRQDNLPMGVQIYQSLQSAGPGVGAVYSLLLIGLMVGVLVVTALLSRRRGVGAY
jgi:iron(III) transport system permease protein